MNYFVYALICPIERDIKYIGCSNNPYWRREQHMNDAHGTMNKKLWIARLKEHGFYPGLLLIACFTDGLQALAAESQLVSSLSGLTNFKRLNKRKKERTIKIITKRCRMEPTHFGEKNSKFKGYYIIHGKRYASAKLAAKDIGIATSTITHRCKRRKEGYSFEPKLCM